MVARLIEFNKRRAGEVSKLTPKAWELRSKWKKGALDAKLSIEETALVNSMELVYVIGKCQKYVPIIFPPDTIQPVSWLCEGKQDDDFVFTNSCNQRLRGSEVIQKFRKEGHFSDVLTSTRLRKSYATNLQVKKLMNSPCTLICLFFIHISAHIYRSMY